MKQLSLENELKSTLIRDVASLLVKHRMAHMLSLLILSWDAAKTAATGVFVEDGAGSVHRLLILLS